MVPQVPDNRKLQGPMVGHFVCVDGFGSPSAEERAAGMAMHGEAYLQPWKLVSSEKQGATTTAKFTVDLPLLQESFTRHTPDGGRRERRLRGQRTARAR